MASAGHHWASACYLWEYVVLSATGDPDGARAERALLHALGHPERHHCAGYSAPLYLYPLHSTLLLLILTCMTRYLALANLIWGQWALGHMPIASAYMGHSDRHHGCPGIHGPWQVGSRAGTVVGACACSVSGGRMDHVYRPLVTHVHYWATKVSHCRISPLVSPCSNHCTRCCDEP
jgi:hypothetical protein